MRYSRDTSRNHKAKSDSGTVQEEPLILGVPCLITRLSTERPETIMARATIMSNKDLHQNAFKAMKLKRNWDRWVLNPTRKSPSEVIFKDLITKINSNFFQKSRSFNSINIGNQVKEAYGIIIK